MARLKPQDAKPGTALEPVKERVALEAEQDNANRRAQQRMEAGYGAMCRVSSISYAVEVKDVSRSGARIVIRQGMMPTTGQLVELSLMGREVVAATVVWTSSAEVGLRFIEELGDESDALHFDDLGAAYFRAVLKFQLAQG